MQARVAAGIQTPHCACFSALWLVFCFRFYKLPEREGSREGHERDRRREPGRSPLREGGPWDLPRTAPGSQDSQRLFIPVLLRRAREQSERVGGC